MGLGEGLTFGEGLGLGIRLVIRADVGITMRWIVTRKMAVVRIFGLTVHQSNDVLHECGVVILAWYLGLNGCVLSRMNLIFSTDFPWLVSHVFIFILLDVLK